MRTDVFQSKTCPCQVWEIWDDSLPPDQVLYQFVAIVTRGPEHARIVDKSLLAVIREETARVQGALAICAAQSPALATNPHAVQWSFTPGRALQLRFQGLHLSGKVRHAIQASCNDRLGLYKVQVF